MTIPASTKRKGLSALPRVQADTENQTITKGTSPMTVQSITDTRTARLATYRQQRRAAWWTIAVIGALVVVLANSPVVTVLIVWAAFVVATRLTVVERRRVRRAAHRAELWQRIATVEAVEVANAHTSREVAA